MPDTSSRKAGEMRNLPEHLNETGALNKNKAGHKGAHEATRTAKEHGAKVFAEKQAAAQHAADDARELKK